MRINELHLQDFGMFHDYTISFDPQAQLIYGDNEQGKTTLMGFIMLMFYGDQGRNSKFNLTLRKKYMPWNGNKSAGTMTFISGGDNLSGRERIWRDTTYRSSPRT